MEDQSVKTPNLDETPPEVTVVGKPEPEAKPPSDIEILMQKLNMMEQRFEEAQKPKPKEKRKASEKQLEVLRKAREKRNENMIKRKEIKKEIKMKEKKIVNEKLEEKKLEEKKDVVDEPIVSTKPKNPSVSLSEEQPVVNMENTHKSNPNIPAIPMPHTFETPKAPAFNFATKPGRRR